jgi:hypothetical protein
MDPIKKYLEIKKKLIKIMMDPLTDPVVFGSTKEVNRVRIKGKH